MEEIFLITDSLTKVIKSIHNKYTDALNKISELTLFDINTEITILNSQLLREKRFFKRQKLFKNIRDLQDLVLKKQEGYLVNGYSISNNFKTRYNIQRIKINDNINFIV